MSDTAVKKEFAVVSGHLPEKMTSFCFPENVFGFRVRVKSLEVKSLRG